MGLLTGQWSDDILPPAEQFYLGGSRFTRGYYAGQVPGDKALAATVELQLNTGFETTLFGKSLDIVNASSTCSTTGARPGRTSSTDHAAMINSAGGGVRMQLTRYVEVDFEGVARFNRFPNGGSARQSASRRCTAALSTGGSWRGSDSIRAPRRREMLYDGEASVAQERGEAARRRAPHALAP